MVHLSNGRIGLGRRGQYSENMFVFRGPPKKTQPMRKRSMLNHRLESNH
jgi:hypothetical protein